MILGQIIFGVIVFFAGIFFGLVVYSIGISIGEFIGKIVAFAGVIIIFNGLFSSESIIYLDPIKCKEVEEKGLKRQENNISNFSYKKLQFEYPSFLVKKQHWGPIKRIIAPFFGVGTLWGKHQIVANFSDPEFKSLFITIELISNEFFINIGFDKENNYRFEEFNINNRNAAIHRFSKVMDNINICADFLYIPLGKDHYFIKCFSLQDSYEDNLNIVNSIFNSVSIKD